jgi:subtilase family serine protease
LRSKSARANGVTQSRRKLRVFAVRVQAILAGAAVLALSTMAVSASASAATQSPAAAASHAPKGKGKGHYAPIKHAKRDYQRACRTPARGKMACNVLVRTNLTPAIQPATTPHAIPAGFGYGPSQLQSAYNLPSSTAGSGQTVAIIDSYDYPTAAADLATYRSAAGLPACGTGCFSKVNQNGAASPLPASAGTTGWDVEEALDIDMVSAICPLCHIILVEANSPSTANLGTAVNSAVSLGAKFVSNSYGGSESSSDPTFDTQYYNHPGVAVTASAGDDGFGVEYPAASKFVTAVGGTSLSTSTNARGWNETVWSGSGSGCSADDAKPTWQTDTGCARRTNNDVSAVADPNTGVAIYNSFSAGGWNEVGGTSASSPIIASTYALAGAPAAGTYPSSYLYAHPSNFYDVTSGSDGTCSPAYLCTGEVGYDGPTGLGTPHGIAAFSNGTTTGNTVTVTSPGNQTGTVGTAASLQIHATDSASGQTLTYSATGLPAGLSISSTTGLISGTPTTAATYSVAVSAKDGTGATGSATFTWTISPTGGGGCTPAQLLGNPGFETGSAAPWTSTAGVINSNGSGETSHGGSWYAWLDGYGTTHTDTLSQTVTIPAACTHTTVSFWLHIDTAETTTTTQFDKLTVTANSTTVATFSNLNHNTGYALETFSLGSFAGSSVTLKFSGTEDSSLQTSFVIDDTAVNTG